MSYNETVKALKNEKKALESSIKNAQARIVKINKALGAMESLFDKSDISIEPEYKENPKQEMNAFDKTMSDLNKKDSE